MSLNYHSIGQKIRELRKSKDISQMALAEMVNVSLPYISYIENGKKHISLEILVQIANVLETTPDILLEEDLQTHRDSEIIKFTEFLKNISNDEMEIIRKAYEIANKSLMR